MHIPVFRVLCPSYASEYLESHKIKGKEIKETDQVLIGCTADERKALEALLILRLESIAWEHDYSRCTKGHLNVRVHTIPFGFKTKDVAIECHHICVVGSEKSNGIEREPRLCLRHHL